MTPSSNLIARTSCFLAKNIALKAFEAGSRQPRELKLEIVAGVLDQHGQPANIRHRERRQPETKVTTEDEANEATEARSNHRPHAQLRDQQQTYFKQNAVAVHDETLLKIGICQSQKVRAVVAQESAALQAQ